MANFSNFRIFKMAAAGILDFWNYKFLTVERAMGVKLRHCAKFLAIGQTVAEISRFLIFF